MPMRAIVSCYFERGGNEQLWPRMARVLEFTARRQCPDWAVHVQAISPAPLRSALGVESHVSNTQKMEHWAAAVAGAPDGAELLLIDADTMIVRPLDAVWDRPFDFAYTTKPSRFPFNSGVVFLRVSPRTRTFVERWRAENRRMLDDQVHHQTWRSKYGGINQAALGFALETDLMRALDVLELPCVEWNCEDSSWAAFSSDQTRIVHIKSRLRRAVFNLGPSEPHFTKLIALWRAFEETATVQPAPSR